MKKLTSHFFRITIGVALCVQLLPVSFAHSHEGMGKASDPQRWSQEDTSSPHDYYLTLKKEAGAALQINLKNCKTEKRASRAACEREARAVFKQDLIDAKQKADEMRQGQGQDQ